MRSTVPVLKAGSWKQVLTAPAIKFSREVPAIQTGRRGRRVAGKHRAANKPLARESRRSLLNVGIQEPVPQVQCWFNSS